MIVMYPLTNTLDYRELKYSLRSVEKHLTGYEVVIVGEQMPDWITGVTWIHVPDIKMRKQLSIKKNIVAALNYSDRIFFMNDDIFLLQETNPYHYPYYFNGSLKPQTEAGTMQLINELKVLGKPTDHFDIHTPIVYKKDFIEVVENFTDDTVIKSMYANYLGKIGTPLTDMKISRPVAPEAIRLSIRDRPCFSTGMGGLGSALQVLQELFPEPSKYELW